MIVNASKLQEAIIQCMEEINDACLNLRNQGITVLLPEYVDFEVNMVTGDDINVVSRTSSEAEADGGTVVTTRQQTTPDTSSSTRSGENFTTTKNPTQGIEVTTIGHPAVRTQQGGGDSSEEEVNYEYVGEG